MMSRLSGRSSSWNFFPFIKIHLPQSPGRTLVTPPSCSAGSGREDLLAASVNKNNSNMLLKTSNFNENQIQ